MMKWERNHIIKKTIFRVVQNSELQTVDIAAITTQAQKWSERISASDAQQQVVND